MGWLLIIALALIFPILLFIHTIYLPTYCMLGYFLWMITSIFVVAYGKAQKIIQKAILPAIITFIYAIFHCVSMYNHANAFAYDIESGTVFAIIFGAFLSLPLILIIGYFLGIPVEEKRREKEDELLNECKKELQKQLSIKSTVLRVLDEYYLTTEKALNLIKLIDNLHKNESQSIEPSYINAENKRFLDYRQSLLLKIDTSERNNFPEKYEDIDLYYYGIKQEIKNLNDRLKNVGNLNIRELKELQKRR